MRRRRNGKEERKKARKREKKRKRENPCVHPKEIKATLFNKPCPISP